MVAIPADIDVGVSRDRLIEIIRDILYRSRDGVFVSHVEDFNIASKHPELLEIVKGGE